MKKLIIIALLLISVVSFAGIRKGGTYVLNPYRRQHNLRQFPDTCLVTDIEHCFNTMTYVYFEKFTYDRQSANTLKTDFDAFTSYYESY